MPQCSAIPLLFLISSTDSITIVYIDNEWSMDAEQIWLDFLSKSVSGEYELGQSSFDEYLTLIESTDLVKLPNVDLGPFLKEQVIILGESMSSMEDLLKEVETLITSTDVNITETSKIGSFCLNAVKKYNDLTFDEAGQFLETFRQYCKVQSSVIHDLVTENCEGYVNAQLSLLVSTVNLPAPNKISLELKRMAEGVSTQNYHYLGYLNALKRGDLQLSVSHLRRHIDYSVKHTDKSSIQISALNMAALNMELNHPKKALECIERGITYARDDNDSDCLSYLLSWLYQIVYESNSIDLRTPFRPSALSLLESLHERTKIQEQHKLMALCELKKANLYLEERSDPDEIKKHLDSAKDLIFKHSLSDLEADVELTKARAFRILGKTLMAVACLQNLSKSGVFLDSSKECLALSQQALYMAELGDFEGGIQILKSLKQKFPLETSGKASKIWFHCSAIVLFKAAYFRRQYENCQHLLDCWRLHLRIDQPEYITYQCNQARLLACTGNKIQAIEILEQVAVSIDHRTSFLIETINCLFVWVDILLVA